MGAGVWEAFLPMRPPTVTHNDLEPFRRRDGSYGIRKSDELHRAEDALDARIMAAGPPVRPLGGPLRVTVAVCYQTDGRRPQGAPHTVRPDLDNLLKTIGDRLQECLVINEDANVCEWHATKAWADPAGVYVRVEEIGDGVGS